MRPTLPILAYAITLGTTFAAVDARAAVLFTEDFNTPTYSSNLEASGGSIAWTSGVAGSGALSGESVIQHQAGSGYERNYIRTVDSDYNTIDFRMQVTFTTDGPDPNSLLFIGLGNGVPGAYGPGEASTGIYLRSHPSAWAGYDSIASKYNDAGSYLSGYAVGNGTHRLQIEKVGDLLTFAIDKNYNGSFAIDYTWASFDLNLPTYSFLDDTNSRLFFGTGTAYPQFDDLTITDLSGGYGATPSGSVPEPSVLALMLFGFGWLARREFQRRG